MSKDTQVIGTSCHADGSMAVMETSHRALLAVTGNDRDALAVMDPEAVVTGTREDGYHVTAPWLSPVVQTGEPRYWISTPAGRLMMSGAGLSVSTQDVIEACMADPDRTVRLADLPQVSA